MSLVPTYVLATDGLYYKNPTIRGEGWFICFDDDDPPEIVIKTTLARDKKGDRLLAIRRLNELGIEYELIGRSHFCKRYFKPSNNFYPAVSMFFKLKSPITPPPGMTGVELPKAECTVETGGLPYKRYGNAEKIQAERITARLSKDSASPG